VISRPNIFKLTLIVALMIVSYLVFSKPNYPQIIPHMDKIGHFGSFFCLGYLTQLAFKPKWPVMVLLFTSYAIFIELVQSRLSYRTASFADFVADMVGIAAFYFCYWLYRRYYKLPFR